MDVVRGVFYWFTHHYILTGLILFFGGWVILMIILWVKLRPRRDE